MMCLVCNDRHLEYLQLHGHKCPNCSDGSVTGCFLCIRKLIEPLSEFECVGDFQHKFGLPAVGFRTMPRLVDKDVSDFRVNFIKEELKELEDAYETQNLEEIADALIDLDYVIKGTGHFHGLPWRALWHEVHRANMEKVRVEGAEDPRSTRPHRFNVVKPEGWKPPDIAGLLNRQKEIAR